MRIELIDTLFAKNNRHYEIPRGMSRVEIGTAARCQVQLTGNVGELVAGLRLEPDGWWFFNLAREDSSPIDITLGPVSIEAGGEVKPTYSLWKPRTKVFIAAPLLSVQFDRYHLQIVFDPDEFSPRAADIGRFEQEMVELVRDVHDKLLNELVKPKADRKEKYKPEYLMQLEKLTDQIASQRGDFPTNDMARTPLGDHMAGVAVKSELIRELIADSGKASQRARGVEPGDADWVRLRTRVEASEKELKKLVAQAKKVIDTHHAGRPDAGDLSARMKALGETFWPHWKKTIDEPAAPGPGTRRYLGLRRVKEEIKDYWYGFGPLEDLLDDPTISEIMVVDRDNLFVETGGQIELSGRRFLSDPLTVINKIVAVGDREINDSLPLVNVRMPDGSRMNAVHSCLALRGTCVTVRRFPKVRLTMPELIEIGTISAAAAEFLKAAVANRRNILVSGGTGSGKTTLLNCLGTFIPEKERIVTIEDTAELQLQHRHVVTLQGRPANLQGEGEISIRELVKNSLRMRPDRIVVGECRGAEALDMLQAMNTGHDGSLTTLHANNPSDVIQRLETMCQMATKELPVESVHRMVASAVDLVVQLTAGYESTTMPDGRVVKRRKRVVSEIAEFVGMKPGGGIVIKALFSRPPEGGPLLPTGCLPTFMADMIDAGLVPDPLAFLRDPAAPGVAV